MIFLGLSLIAIGHIFRIGAEFSAKKNFSHVIATRKKNQHTLVTDGIYRLNLITIV